MPKDIGFRVALFTALMLGILTLYIARLDAALTIEPSPHPLGEAVEVSGVVRNDPERRDTSLHVYIDNLLVLLPRDAGVSYGDRLVVRGKISLPENFETDAGRKFNYENYLRVRGIHYLMRYAEVVDREEGGWSIQKSLYALKHSFEASLEKILPEPNVSLMEGILLGARRGIPDNLTDAFVVSGLIHVVVLSGYNISIVAEAMLRGLSFLPRTYGFLVGGMMMILFALMTGAGAATVRATIMGLIAVLARYLHRPSAALRALAVAAVAMALWNPLAPLYDVSFILSIVATFGLITLSPWVESWLPKFFNKVPSIRSIAASTIAVQIFILPALLYFTGVLSFFSLPANILALPVVPFVMLLGFIAGLLGLIHPALAIVPAVIANTLLEWMIFIATATASLPFSSTIVAEFPLWVVIAIYIPLTWFALRCFKRSTKSNLQEYV